MTLLLGLNLFMGKMYYCANIDDIDSHLVPEEMGMSNSAMTISWCKADAGAHFYYCPSAADPLHDSRNFFTEAMELPSTSVGAWNCSVTTASSVFTLGFDSKLGGTYGQVRRCNLKPLESRVESASDVRTSTKIRLLSTFAFNFKLRQYSSEWTCTPDAATIAKYVDRPEMVALKAGQRRLNR
jgi:hypothetical protein